MFVKCFNKFAKAACLGLSVATAQPAMAVLTPGPGVTLYPLPTYQISLGSQANTDGMFNELFVGFDATGGSSFQLTSLTSVGDSVRFTATFDIDKSVAEWDLTGVGGHRSRLFLQAGVGAPLGAPLGNVVQRNDMNQTPGVTMEYNTAGFNDNTNWDYTLDNTNQIAAGDFTFGDTNTADLDLDNGAAPDTQTQGGTAALTTTIVRTGASSYDWTSQVDYYYDDAPSTVIATASRTGALVLPGTIANTYYTPYNQLGIGDTTGPYSLLIQYASLTFDIAPVVPEPATMGLAGMASLGLIAARRRLRQS